MKDAHRVTVLDSVDNLEENLLDQGVVSEILQGVSEVRQAAPCTHPLLLCDHAKQIPFVAKVHDDKDVVSLFDNLVQCHDIGVSRSELMQGDLSTLEMPLPRVKSSAKQALDCEVDGFRRMQVDGEVYDAIGSKTKNREEFQSTIVQGVSDE